MPSKHQIEYKAEDVISKKLSYISSNPKVLQYFSNTTVTNKLYASSLKTLS